MPFDGDRMKIKTFISECIVYLDMNNSIYDTDKPKIAFMLSFMTEKEALQWKEQYLCSITGPGRKMTYLTFDNFVNRLEEAFNAVNEMDLAIHKLALL